jgi:DNA-binding transcriptional MocR family regulator
VSDRKDRPLPIAGHTARAIAASVERAIEQRRLPAGQRLPPIRDVAARLNVSPATVAAAYRAVQMRGLVAGDGRNGTRVRSSSQPGGQTAMSALVEGTVDLASGNPDLDLLPPLGPALGGLDPAPHLYGDPLQFQPLVAFAASEFAADGIATTALCVVGGALDGLERMLREHVRTGDHVAIEDPVLPAIVDLVTTTGLVPLPVAVDAEGPRPDSLRAALRRRATAVILTPRAQNPTGAALSIDRVAALKEVLGSFPDALVIENDAAGPISGAPARTVCDDSRAHWAVIRSTSKFLGPDIRVAVAAGDPLTIGRVQRRQAAGAGWVSHLLQRLALALWSDPSSGRLFARAAAIYGQRRGALVEALRKEGVELAWSSGPPSGIHVWIPVAAESSTVHALAQKGWAVAAGERFRQQSAPAIRVTASTLVPDEARRFAADLAAIRRPATAVFA